MWHSQNKQNTHYIASGRLATAELRLVDGIWVVSVCGKSRELAPIQMPKTQVMYLADVFCGMVVTEEMRFLD